MADTPETKASATTMRHVEDAGKRASADDINPEHQEQEQRDADEIEKKYALPMREVLERHLEENQLLVRRMRRKVDFRLVPMLSLLYMWAFIDRANLGNVRVTVLLLSPLACLFCPCCRH